MGQAFLDVAAVPAEAMNSPQRAAIIAAQAGDWGPDNRMELAFINDPENGIEPYFDEEGEDEYGHYVTLTDAKAFEIRKGDDGLRVLWVRHECGGELRLCNHRKPNGHRVEADDCTACRGTGWHAAGNTNFEFFETDIDGRVTRAGTDHPY